ncbi:alpha/beta hydrolase family protein [Lysobacter soli]|uniref:alpha/beta hydrolase family protein n=1 Tax=Lysobacter soli TaxID=453783 RepID=UPI00240F5448|nr:alpha/beta hydrolase [Lysobacter soli]MDG2519359.1 alpha/beta hydrolase [Lysobacter soli]
MRGVVLQLALAIAMGFAAQVKGQALTGRALPLELQRQTVPGEKGKLDILVRHDGIRRPVLVILPGSACMAAFMLVQQPGGVEAISSVMRPNAADLKEMGVHLAILERRNITSFDHVYRADEVANIAGLERHACTDAHGGVTLEHRVHDVQAQLEYLRRQEWAGDILLAGISEGADVATAVAAKSPEQVHALALIVGAGMSQFFDFVHQRRLEDDTAGVAQVFADLDAFLSGNPPNSFMGLPAERWASFAIQQTNLDSLLASRSPLFIVQGDRDESVPVASVDALVVEVMRRQPGRPVYYLSVVGGGHDLRNALTSPSHSIYPEFVRWSTGGRAVAPTGPWILISKAGDSPSLLDRDLLPFNRLMSAPGP